MCINSPPVLPSFFSFSLQTSLPAKCSTGDDTNLNPVQILKACQIFKMTTFSDCKWCTALITGPSTVWHFSLPPLGPPPVLLPNPVPQPQALVWQRGQPGRLQSSQKWVSLLVAQRWAAWMPSRQLIPHLSTSAWGLVRSALSHAARMKGSPKIRPSVWGFAAELKV